MSESSPFTQSHRRFLRSSLAGFGAMAGLTAPAFEQARAESAGRKTDTVRLTWRFNGLNLIARERGEFEKVLARNNIKVEWLGPFPNHAPTMQAVTGAPNTTIYGIFRSYRITE